MSKLVKHISAVMAVVLMVSLFVTGAMAAPSAEAGTLNTSSNWSDFPLQKKGDGNFGERYTKLIQLMLNTYYSTDRSFEQLTIDGVFGSGTEAAVKKFQAQCNITQDGKVGSTTWSRLQNLLWAKSLLDQGITPVSIGDESMSAPTVPATPNVAYTEYVIRYYHSTWSGVKIRYNKTIGWQMKIESNSDWLTVYTVK